jgi:hypothetical protein
VLPEKSGVLTELLPPSALQGLSFPNLIFPGLPDFGITPPDCIAIRHRFIEKPLPMGELP